MAISGAHLRSNHRVFYGERGAAFIEFAIVVPVLVILFIGVFDIGRMLQTYLSLVQTAREGVRFAASLPLLEKTNAQNWFENVDECAASPGAFGCCSDPADEQVQCAVHMRIRKLLGMTGINAPRVFVRTKHYGCPLPRLPGGACMETEVPNSIDVELSMQYQSMFETYRELFITVQERGPYLYGEAAKNCADACGTTFTGP